MINVNMSVVVGTLVAATTAVLQEVIHTYSLPVSVVISIITGIAGGAGSWGLMRGRMNQNKDDIAELRLTLREHVKDVHQTVREVNNTLLDIQLYLAELRGHRDGSVKTRYGDAGSSIK